MVVSISAGAIAIVYAHAQTPATSTTSALEPMAFLTTHEWDAKLPDSPEGTNEDSRAIYVGTKPSGYSHQ